MKGFVEVTGRVLDYYTLEPIQVRVRLMGDDATSAKDSQKGTVQLATEVSDQDGTFKLRSKPSKRSNYYIHISDGDFKELNIQENQSNALGDFISGQHTFTCSITIIPRSDSSLHVAKGSLQQSYYSFSSGTSATVQNTMTIYASGWRSYNKSFPIWYTTYCYYPAHYSTNYFIAVPISALNAPLTTTLYY
ncbi:MAG TPA: hypothetical protein PLQ93_06620 [Bacteroidia bacterium]|nr:hypothetical protein [Bacteroidia bacterium]